MIKILPLFCQPDYNNNFQSIDTNQFYQLSDLGIIALSICKVSSHCTIVVYADSFQKSTQWLSAYV